MTDLSQYRELYLEELDEQLQYIEEEVLRLEHEGAADTAIDRLFRAAHTLKGSSAAMGYHKMKEVTHHMEHLLHQVRNGERTVTKPLINLMFAGLDVMKGLQEEIVRTDVETSDISALLQQLQEFSMHVKPAIPEGEPLFSIKVALSPNALMQHPRLVLVETELARFGTLLDSEPSLWEPLKEEELSEVTWTLATNHMDENDLRKTIGSIPDVERVDVAPCSPTEFSGDAKEERPGDMKQPPAQRAVYSETKSKSQTIRVHIERLDHLMNLAGELVIDQTRIQQVKTLFRQRYGSDDLIEELFQLSDHLSLLISELQDGVMKARMLPIEQLYNRFPRMIRDLAESLGKQVDLVLQGKDTELDRTLIEEIGDPLIHLLRNAVDHGIEAPEQRRLSGKCERGTVTLSAAHQDNHVVISIRDDGAGIDVDKLREAAVSKGLLSHNEVQRLTDEEALHLIFKPGFSTASEVSDVSGRGVGMDIVRNNIERMSGMIDIESVKEQGTLFRIRLPLTLAIVTGLLVNISGRIFIIPMSSVAEITRIETGEIQRLRGEPVIKIRHQVIPVVWLHDHFQFPRPPVRRFLPMVIIGRAEKRVALAVDELMGNQEIVIKSLGGFIGKIDGISGATILGSGNVALILDVDGVIKLSSNA
ncbi:chemotaxis protein CheA [uncultured Paenibacillus sp.]|uniref:chemotaxis protein CheA n=1 Tax=uncultured Paenibacillus sp. TaxID=227322 RepID=UPI0015AA827B|nr:chemotaxis protein CheA [uncultured Paenibacillus sp.]